jgi:PAP2 superfamily
MSTMQQLSASNGPGNSWSAPAGDDGVSTPSTLRRWWGGRLGYALMLEVALMGAVFVGYRQVRYLTKGDTSTAFANASAVVRMEQDLGVFTERAVQRLVMHSEALIHVMNRYYVTMHFPVTVIFIVWAFVRHQDAYRAIRACFLIVTASALVIHVAYPLAPPRMLRAQGFVDTLGVYGPRIYSTDTTKSLANQFAAMPSLHFGWAVLVALGFVYIKRSRWSLVLLAHPVLTLFAIVATGNHYWVDAAVAMVLVLMAIVLVARFVTGEQPAHEPTVLYQPFTHAIAGSPGLDAGSGARACVRAHDRSRTNGSRTEHLVATAERWIPQAPNGQGWSSSSSERRRRDPGRDTASDVD